LAPAAEVARTPISEGNLQVREEQAVVAGLRQETAVMPHQIEAVEAAVLDMTGTAVLLAGKGRMELWSSAFRIGMG